MMMMGPTRSFNINHNDEENVAPNVPTSTIAIIANDEEQQQQPPHQHGDIESPSLLVSTKSDPLLPQHSNRIDVISKMIGKFIGRILIALIGVLLGLVTIIPNMFMMDSGTDIATTAASIGIFASLTFVIGGVLGAIFKTWWGLLPGLVLQIIALMMLPRQ